MSESRIPPIIASLYILVDELETLFPERKFTLDGHLVGSIGEVVAKYLYKLKLLPVGNQSIDALTLDGSNRSVQIKLTAGNAVSLADYEDHPDLLILLTFDRESGFDEVYNGQYPLSLLVGKKVTKRQVKILSVQQLRREQRKVQRCLDDEGRIDELNRYFRKGNP
jgi:hypothetical protein